jgi:hypothetical protein
VGGGDEMAIIYGEWCVSVVMCMDRRHCGGGGGGVQSPNYWQKQIVMTLNNIQM